MVQIMEISNYGGYIVLHSVIKGEVLSKIAPPQKKFLS